MAAFDSAESNGASRRHGDGMIIRVAASRCESRRGSQCRRLSVRATAARTTSERARESTPGPDTAGRATTTKNRSRVVASSCNVGKVRRLVAAVTGLDSRVRRRASHKGGSFMKLAGKRLGLGAAALLTMAGVALVAPNVASAHHLDITGSTTLSGRRRQLSGRLDGQSSGHSRLGHVLRQQRHCHRSWRILDHHDYRLAVTRPVVERLRLFRQERHGVQDDGDPTWR